MGGLLTIESLSISRRTKKVGSLVLPRPALHLVALVLPVRELIREPSEEFCEKSVSVPMGPLYRLSSLFSTSVVDVNNNAQNNPKMGLKSKKNKFSSDLDIFAREAERIKAKTYMWASIRIPKKNKESSRATVKGGRTSPVVRPPVHPRAPPKPAPQVAEALAVLVQHLVFNVEAYKVPTLKREVQKLRQDAADIRLAYENLQENLTDERSRNAQAVEAERVKRSVEVAELLEKHRTEIVQLNKQQYDLERRLAEENEATKATLSKQNEEQLVKLKIEFQRLQKTHDESLEILREENEAIREQIDEKNASIGEARHESAKLKEDYEAKEMKLKEQLQFLSRDNQRMRQELAKAENKISERVEKVHEENGRLREEYDRILSYGDNSGISMQEVQSLRAVLELKQNEVSELRRALAEANQKNELLTGAEEKAAMLTARCEDLQLQLQRKSEYEQSLIAENKKLHDSFKEEINQKKRLCQYNEELRWKLTQNKEVVSKVLEQAEETALNRSLYSSSFNERHSASANKLNLERALSFREPRTPTRKTARNGGGEAKDQEEESPPSSPKVKGVVEKSDWVSYVLDLDESPEIVASRIVRRSFRNSTPPKTTPTKSPSNKRPRMKNPLSLSASASAILPTVKNDFATRSLSVSARNGDPEDFEPAWATSTPTKRSFDGRNNGRKFDDHLDPEDRDVGDHDHDHDDDHDVDLQLPALPSEMGGRKNGARALPSPKHLAGEAMVSESNSEDESTSSSSVL